MNDLNDLSSSELVKKVTLGITVAIPEDSRKKQPPFIQNKSLSHLQNTKYCSFVSFRNPIDSGRPEYEQRPYSHRSKTIKLGCMKSQ